MKILMLCGAMGRGGAETHIATLCQGLLKLGCEITALTSGGETADQMEASGIRIVRLPIQSKNPLIRLYVAKKLRQLLRQESYDILHAHTRLSARFLKHLVRKNPPFPTAQAKSKKLRSKETEKSKYTHSESPARIVTLHAAFRRFPFERRLCDWGEFTVTVSEDLRRYAMQRYRIPPERIRVIPNGIDLSRFSPSEERLNRLKSAAFSDKNTYTSCKIKEESSETDTGIPWEQAPPATCNAAHTPDKSKENIPLNTRRMTIAFASRMDRDCALGAKLLLELAPVLCRMFPALSILLSGGGNAYEEIQKEAEKINRELGIQAVTATGHVADMSEVLKSADIFLGVSRAAIEAAAMGCAVILCGNEGYGGILSGENAVFHSLSNFCARNGNTACAEMLKKDLLFLLNGPHVCDFYAFSAMHWVRMYCGSEQMCRSTLALYHRAQHIPQNRRILAGGYFACGNLGDDAILSGIRDGLWELAPTVTLTALSANPKKTQKSLGIPSYGRKALPQILLGMHRAELYLCGGGSLLQNKSGNCSLLYYLCTIQLGRLLGKRTALFAAGIGPLSGNFARRQTVHTLQRCNYISLRDEDSLHFLCRIGLSQKPMFASSDPALLLSPPPPSRAAFLLSEHGILHNVRCFCIILKGGKESSDIARLVLGASRILASRHALTPILLVFDVHADRAATKNACGHLKGAVCVPIEEVRDAIAILSHSEIVLSMRLHGLILSTVAATPALGVASDASDGKIPSFARQSGQEYLLPGEVSAGAIVEIAERMLAERKTRIPFLRAALADLRKKAKKDLENLLAIRYNNRQNE